MSLLQRTFQTIRSILGIRGSSMNRFNQLGNNESSHDRRCRAGEPFESGEASSCLCYVEFMGGPLDGYLEGLPVAVDQLAATIAVPVSPTRLIALSGAATPITGTPHPTSVAFYELDAAQAVPPRYTFLGAARPQDARGIWMREIG